MPLWSRSRSSSSSRCNSEAHASPDKKRPNYGRVKLSTNPGGFPILIDGQPAGNTTASERLIDLAPGPHTIEILFPQERWTREFVVSAGRIYCIGLAYAPRSIPLPAALPCPYPVNVSAPAQVADGEVITFASNVSYRARPRSTTPGRSARPARAS